MTISLTPGQALCTPVTTTWHSGQGWSLVTTQLWSGEPGLHGSVVEYSASGLRGLAVTREEARALTELRYRGQVDVVVTPRGLVADATLTRAEYLAILDGQHPLVALLPPFRARALTLEELMSA